MRKLYMIGNTHFDPVWLWKWDEAMASIRATFRSALDRMNEDEQFIYSFATPPVFEWIKNTDEGMFEEIKKRVEEGRWELAEGWWVQPDCYSACGESYVRQGLYGQKYLRENFNRLSNCVFNIDSFGHSPALPQILKKSHIEYYCFVRPEKRHISLKAPLFRWKGIDGSEILTFRAEDAYSKNLDECVKAQADKERDAMIVYGVTDHGGAPTKKMLSWIRQNKSALCSRVDQFFKEHANCDYVVDRELLTGDFGPYSNYGKIKKLNRIAEYALLNAEKASLIGGNYKQEVIASCWQDVLFNQFHDILGGACIKDAYFDAENTLGRAIQTATEILHFNLQQVTRQMKTVGKNPDDIWNVVVWNLNGSEYEGYIEAEVQWAHEFDWYDKGIELCDEEEIRYPCQIIREKSVIPKFRSRFVFKDQIPSVGYKMYRVIQTGELVEQGEVNPYSIETKWLKIYFSKESGTITSVYDKKKGLELCKDILVPRCYFDDGDTWAFNIEEYDSIPNDFSFKNMRMIEAGQLRTIVRVTYQFQDSILEMYYTFYQEENYFDVSYRVNWNEKHYVLKLETKVNDHKHTVAVPYGSVRREITKRDVPLGAWLQSDNFSVSADGIFSYNMREHILGLTILRSPIYGDYRMGELDYEEDYDIISQGINEGKIRIDFNRGTWTEAESFLNQPVVIIEANHDGILPSKDSFYRISGKGVSMSAIKKCEYDDGVIVRLFEHTGEVQSVMLYVGDKTFSIDMLPYEIKTLKIKEQSIEEYYMTEDSLYQS